MPSRQEESVQWWNSVSQVSRYLEPELVEHLNHMQLSARSVGQGGTMGPHRSPVKGASVEFRQHRFYVPGDEPRRFDWRVKVGVGEAAFTVKQRVRNFIGVRVMRS